MAGVRADAAADDVPPGVAVVRDDRFGLGEDTALVKDSKKLAMVFGGGVGRTMKARSSNVASSCRSFFWLG